MVHVHNTSADIQISELKEDTLYSIIRWLDRNRVRCSVQEVETDGVVLFSLYCLIIFVYCNSYVECVKLNKYYLIE